MKLIHCLSLIAGTGMLVLPIFHCPAFAAPAEKAPVIVELFTSEGCSSCPPADAVLTRLIKRQPVEGAEVIALGEHVDYWNHNGWADPFSSSKFSARQYDYSQSFGKDNVYTPQAVVDGQTEFVGSDEDRADQVIARAARLPKADVQLSYPAAGQLSVKISHLPISVRNDHADVLLAITEDGLTSSVGGGENSGRHLVHSAVVRELRVLGSVSSDQFAATVPITLNSRWRQPHLHIVVFVQQRHSRRIIGAAEESL